MASRESGAQIAKVQRSIFTLGNACWSLMTPASVT